MNMYTHNSTYCIYNNVHTHKSVPPCTDVGWAYGGRWGVGWCVRDNTNITNHIHAHLVGFGGVCMWSIHYAQCFGHYQTWGGGVNGHDVNLRDDVTG